MFCTERENVIFMQRTITATAGDPGWPLIGQWTAVPGPDWLMLTDSAVRTVCSVHFLTVSLYHHYSHTITPQVHTFPVNVEWT